MNKVIVVVGPTGVGKTKLGVELAKYFKSEVINGDSVQIYKEMNIGSAKVTEEETEGIKHHLLDFKEIEENYTVYDYQQDLRKKIKEFNDNNLLPIVVGGTGLYLKAALYDYSFNKEDDKDMNEYENYSNEDLYALLKEKDEKAASSLHPNNRRRVVRALNIIENSGMKKSEIIDNQEHKPLYDVVFIGLTLPRELLYKRIDDRVDIMVKNGLLKEVKGLYDKYNDKDYKSLQAIGYKELFLHYKGELTLQESLDLIKKKSRNYAKRQYTWFNNQFNVKWFNVNLDKFDKTVNEIIQYLCKERGE